MRVRVASHEPSVISASVKPSSGPLSVRARNASPVTMPTSAPRRASGAPSSKAHATTHSHSANRVTVSALSNPRRESSTVTGERNHTAAAQCAPRGVTEPSQQPPQQHAARDVEQGAQAEGEVHAHPGARPQRAGEREDGGEQQQPERVEAVGGGEAVEGGSVARGEMTRDGEVVEGVVRDHAVVAPARPDEPETQCGAEQRERQQAAAPGGPGRGRRLRGGQVLRHRCEGRCHGPSVPQRTRCASRVRRACPLRRPVTCASFSVQR